MKTRNDRVEDDLLEDAWASSVDKAAFEIGCDSWRLHAHDSSSSGQNENIGSNIRFTHESPSSTFRAGSELKGKAKSRDIACRPKAPKSEFSGIAISTVTSVNRVPTFRWKRPGSHEINEDHELEEAFVDAEIFSPKQVNTSKKVNVVARWPPARNVA